MEAILDLLIGEAEQFQHIMTIEGAYEQEAQFFEGKKDREEEEEEIVVKYDVELTEQEMIEVCLLIYECFLRDNPEFQGIKSIGQVKDMSALTWNLYQMYMVKINGRIVGVGEYIHDLDNSLLDWINVNQEAKENITTVGVREKYRRRGIGRKIVERIIADHAKETELVLNVHASDDDVDGIIAFYQDCGFKIDEELTDEDEYYLKLPRE